mmetsp:Transcript_20442/g.38267  ORF Transcript_20442/g.38267 Transcript_20442/m.38267 type:complete len:303 (+) Transcript_20442:6103-7011(+)
MSKNEELGVWQELCQYVETYRQIVFVNYEDVSSNLLRTLKRRLDSKAVIFISKNTVIKAALKWRMKKPSVKDKDYRERQAVWFPMPELQVLSDLCKQKVILVFCIASIEEVIEVILSTREQLEHFRYNIAARDLYVEPGCTRFHFNSTNEWKLLHTMKIPNKLLKGWVCILERWKVAKKGQAYNNAMMNFFSHLTLEPIYSTFTINDIYDNGHSYSAATMDMAAQSVEDSLEIGVRSLLDLQEEIVYPTSRTVSSGLINAFVNLARLAYIADFTFTLPGDRPHAEVSGDDDEGLLELFKESL